MVIKSSESLTVEFKFVQSTEHEDPHFVVINPKTNRVMGKLFYAAEYKSFYLTLNEGVGIGPGIMLTIMEKIAALNAGIKPILLEVIIDKLCEFIKWCKR